jgi:hypothetical protein
MQVSNLHSKIQYDNLSTLLKVKGGWSYNFNGLDGGWLISKSNAIDAFRMAIQYGLSDAVMIGAKSVSLEGCDSFEYPVKRGD